MKRRITSLFLCILMLVSVLASCKDEKNAEKSATSESSEAQTSVDNSNPNESENDDSSEKSENDESSKEPENGSEAVPKSNGTLFVNGKDISKEHYVYFDSKNERAKIPFLAIMEEFGATVTWKDENNANVRFVTSRGMTYNAVLNVKDGTFIREDIDYFKNSSRKTDKYEIVNGEFLVDSEVCFRFFYYNLGTSFERDWENKKIVMYRKDYEQKARLIVDGTDITDNHHVAINYGLGTAELPFIAILTEFDAEITWLNDTQAKVILNNNEYVLDTKPANAILENEASFKDIETQTEFFDFDSSVLLGVCYSGVENGEFIISASCLRNIETLMNIEISVDYENAVVYINTIEY